MSGEHQKKNSEPFVLSVLVCLLKSKEEYFVTFLLLEQYLRILAFCPSRFKEVPQIIQTWVDHNWFVNFFLGANNKDEVLNWLIKCINFFEFSAKWIQKKQLFHTKLQEFEINLYLFYWFWVYLNFNLDLVLVNVTSIKKQTEFDKKKNFIAN